MNPRTEFLTKKFNKAIETSYTSPSDRKFRRAFTLGWEAAKTKDSRDECPYHDHRTNTNKITFSRAYISQWRNGYDFFGFIVRDYLKGAFGRTGWMAPDGTYYAVDYKINDWTKRLHFGLAVELTDELYPGQATGSDFDFVNGPQSYLMRRGWIRVDHHEADFMVRPTTQQYDTLQTWFNWRISEPSGFTVLDHSFYRQLQGLCNWLRGNPTGDYEDFEDKLLENRSERYT